jgi:hypothetical protein
MPNDNRKEISRMFRTLLIERMGDQCLICGDKTLDNLQFAHIERTEISEIGRGRGKFNRLRDVFLHRDSYVLLCHVCHVKFDNGEIPKSIVLNKS